MEQDNPSRPVTHTIRNARPDDAEAISAMTLRLIPDGAVGRDIAAYREYFSQPKSERVAGTQTVVACDFEDIAIGFLIVRPDTDVFSGEVGAYIERIATTEAAEGTGVGRQLIGWAAEWAASQGYRTIALVVFANNERARRFYGRNGYEEDFVRLVRTLDE